jgi:hypothetical protein
MRTTPAGAQRVSKTNAPTGAAVVSGSSAAKRTAAAILEVLGGVRTPTQAAQALGLAVPKYYHVENRALQGLVAACEPRHLGRVVTADSQLAKLQRAHERLQRDHARQQALLRAAQRTIGLPPPAPEKRNADKKRTRRPSARALKAAARLRTEPPAPAPKNDNAESPAQLRASAASADATP